MDFRQIITDELDRQGMTQTRLAELSGVARHRINDFIHGKRGVTSDSLGRMFDALGVKVIPSSRRRTKTKTKGR